MTKLKLHREDAGSNARGPRPRRDDEPIPFPGPAPTGRRWQPRLSGTDAADESPVVSSAALVHQIEQTLERMERRLDDVRRGLGPSFPFPSGDEGPPNKAA